MRDGPERITDSTGSAREGYTRCRSRRLVVGGRFGLDGTHGVGAGEGRQRRSLVQFDGQGVRARHAGGGLEQGPGQRRRGGRGWTKPRAVRGTGRTLPDRACNRAAGGQLPSAAGQAGRHPEGRRQDATAGDSHGQGPRRSDGSKVRARTDLRGDVLSDELRLPAGAWLPGRVARGGTTDRGRPHLRGGCRPAELLRPSLMQRVEERISDGRILGLLRSWLAQDILRDTERWTPTEGTPQGAVISPLLANIYLHPLDQRIAARGYRMVRYADDFVVLCKSREEAEAALAEGGAFVNDNGLRLHPDKTHIGDCRNAGEGFDFLGYLFGAVPLPVR